MITWIDGGVTAPKGFLSSGVHCGIRKGSNKNDLALIFSSQMCDAAGVYTKNKVKGAPILVIVKPVCYAGEECGAGILSYRYHIGGNC